MLVILLLTVLELLSKISLITPNKILQCTPYFSYYMLVLTIRGQTLFNMLKCPLMEF